MTSHFDIPEFSALLGQIQDSAKPLIVVLGHTASGKTGFSIHLAEFLASKNRKVEIINADSRQLYKHMDIGTAKISDAEKRGVVHHMLDVLDPKDSVNISWYKERAEQIINDCHSRNVVPILVGGSMLYISAIIDGLDPLPAADPKLRQKLSDEYDRDGGETLWNRLNDLDPEAAAGIHKNNKVYLIRALEIVESTGTTTRDAKKQNSCPYDLFIYGLAQEPEVRAERINARTKKLLQSGWIEEVQRLMELGYTKDDPGMISVGYREIFESLHSPLDPQTLAEQISAKTRQYAKRQMTWWKNDQRIHWVKAE